MAQLLRLLFVRAEHDRARQKSHTGLQLVALEHAVAARIHIGLVVVGMDKRVHAAPPVGVGAQHKCLRGARGGRDHPGCGVQHQTT